MSTEIYPPGVPNIEIHQRWHAGEYKMQALAKTPKTVLSASRFFRPFMTAQHQDFVQGLQYMFLGTLDEHGRPWVSMLTSPPGFMQSSDPKVLEIRTRVSIGPSTLSPFSSSTAAAAAAEAETEAALLLSRSSSSSGGVQANRSSIKAAARDPILHNIMHGERFEEEEEEGRRHRRRTKTYWGGVALDFSNRRRNKMNGVLYYPEGVVRLDEDSGELHVRLTVEQTIGNCPKYITIREIRPRSDRDKSGIQDQQKLIAAGKVEQQLQQEKERRLVADLGSSAPQPMSHGREDTTSTTTLLLSDYEQDMIRQADCVFLATRFIDDTLPAQTNGMDCNHRGGNPGFVRVKDNTILIPDYSGNRFFQSLGNVVNDPRIGLLFICFDKGDTLHVTGRATVLLGEEAQAVYQRVQRVVVVEIDEVLLQRRAIPFVLEAKELSPYNPRIARHTSHGMTHGQHSQDGGGGESGDKQGQQHVVVERVNTARLTKIDRLSHDVASFYFRTTEPIVYTPGQYAVLDFSAFNTVGYQHMNNDHPQSLNDDFIRTWTISSAPKAKVAAAAGSGQLENNLRQQSNSITSGSSSQLAIEWEAQSEFTVTVKRKTDGAISTILHRLAEYMEDVEGVGRKQLDREETGRGAFRHHPLLEIPFLATDGEFVLPVPTSPSAGTYSSSVTVVQEEEDVSLAIPRGERETSETPETFELHSSAAANATSEPRFGSKPAADSSFVLSAGGVEMIGVPALVPVPADHEVAAASSSWTLGSLDGSPAAALAPALASDSTDPLATELASSPPLPIRLVLLAGGIGVTPFLSMIRGIQEILLACAGTDDDDDIHHHHYHRHPSSRAFIYEVDLLVSGSTYDDTLTLALNSLLQRMALIPEEWRDQLRLRVTALVSDSSSIPVDTVDVGGTRGRTGGSGTAVLKTKAHTTSDNSTSTTMSTTSDSSRPTMVTVVGGRLTKTRLDELVPDLKDWRVQSPASGSSMVVPVFAAVAAAASASSPQKPQRKQQEQPKQQQRYQQTKVLLCGPPSYMEAAKKFLQELQVPVSCVYTEEFTF
ncbi:hypothetical protein DFQ26_005122 [Actinomortierella ambigua]|nr:hypothetical protein DFQ26_005122 [Actinomortierella ambigua]